LYRLSRRSAQAFALDIVPEVCLFVCLFEKGDNITFFILRWVLAVGFTGLLSGACTCLKPDGKKSAERRSLAPFDSIVITVPVNLTLEQSRTFDCTVSSDSNIIGLLGTTIVNRTLYIEEKGCWLKSGNPALAIRVPNVRYVCVQAENAQVLIERFNLEALVIEQQAAGKVVLEAQINRLKLGLISGSACKATGTARVVSVDLGSEAKLEARGLVAQSLRLVAQPNSRAEVHATDSLIIRSTRARVLYLGKPVYSSTLGAGIVQGNSIE
jgi:hypothetical protein